MKKHIRELLSTPISTLILLVGIIISMLSIKIGLEIYEGGFNYRDNLRVYMEENEAINIENTKNGLKLLEENNSEFSTEPFTIFISKGAVRQAINTYATNTKTLLPKEIKITKGEVERMGNGEKTVIIGEYLEQYTEEIQGKSYLKIENIPYEVIGVFKGTRSYTWDFSMFIDYNSMPQSFNEELLTGVILKEGKSKDILTSNNISFSKVNLNALKATAKKTALDFDGREIKQVFPLLIIGVINTMIFSILWGNDMKRNIEIKKILGAKNNDIIFDMLQKLFLILGVATIITNLVYIALREYLKTIFDLIAQTTLQNSFIAFSVTFILCLCSLGILYFNVMKYKLGGALK